MEKKTINAKIIEDSIDPRGNRITTFLLTYPRFIHSELMSHRMFSRNSASSRAIPFDKMIKMVEEDPFIPIAWQKDHKGMQGDNYITKESEIDACLWDWSKAKEDSILRAKVLYNNNNVTKQLCNRLLEPFMWHTVLLTATEFENFFELRCPNYSWKGDLHNGFKSRKDMIKAFIDNNLEVEKLPNINNNLDWLKLNQSQAEIHIQALAEGMWDAMNDNSPKELKGGEWHIPFGNKIRIGLSEQAKLDTFKSIEDLNIKIATARCARLSYMTYDKEIDYKKDIKLHDRLLNSGHMSPFEHCAKVMTSEEYESFTKGKGDSVSIKDDYTQEEEEFNTFDKYSKGWCNNFRGFIQYRYLIENK